ncbi:hypothetical protein DFH08DRAFT_892327 [Mycena albidolilacea]|uniref:F-box domain-containing protein n=1 Tax=Mycena albidolilacea TaxID=1033008 RepID=A0AAD6ZDD5_9AGAR|nr:hypothetical protein DFH08DRAFT_892327 [Mycena albidolilacea]
MHDLPPELQVIILSLLDKEDICLLRQVSRSLRQLGALLLLSRDNVLPSQIQSGIVCLPEESCYFLIPIVSDIHPIQKLSIIPGFKGPSFRVLPSILAAIPQIPEVLISGEVHAQRNPGIAKLITTLSRNGQDPVVIVGRGSIEHISLPRKIRRWKQSWFMGMWKQEMSIETLDQTLDHTLRFKPMHGHSLRIQTVSASRADRFTLVAFTGVPPSGLILTQLPALSSARYAAVLTALDLGDDLHRVTVKANIAIDFSALLGFIRRHQSLHGLTLEPGAIHRASLARQPTHHTLSGHITSLISPAMYIPAMLRMERHIDHVFITSAAHGSELTRALEAISSAEIGASVRKLNIYLTAPLIRQTVPWRAKHGDAPEAPLRGILHLVIHAYFQYRAEDLQAIPRWLARFPALVTVRFPRTMVHLSEQPALAQAIGAGRANTAEWNGVYFNA